MTPIRLTSWMAQFCTWHEQFKAGTLGPDELPSYLQARQDLNALLVMAQGLDIHAPNGARQAVRIARAVLVEFELESGWVSSLTQDISVSGLSAILGDAPEVGSILAFRLKLGREIQSIPGLCRVVAKIPLQGSVRMAATFAELSKEGRGHIETLMLDAACAEIRRMLRTGRQDDRPATPGATPIPNPLQPGP